MRSSFLACIALAVVLMMGLGLWWTSLNAPDIPEPAWTPSEAEVRERGWRTLSNENGEPVYCDDMGFRLRYRRDGMVDVTADARDVAFDGPC